MSSPDTLPSTPPAGPPSPPPASVWEDFIDIFFAPAAVFRRRERGNFWIPLLVVTVLITVLTFANRNVLQPVYDTEFSRNAPQITQANPQVTPEALAKMRTVGFLAAEYGPIVFVPLMILTFAFVAWGLAKALRIRFSWNAALVVASYSMVPRVLQQVALSIQGLLVDPVHRLTAFSITIGPARFMDPKVTSPLVSAVVLHLDLFILWTAVLVTIGVAVLGKPTRVKAFTLGVLFWIVTMTIPLYGAIKTMLRS